MASLQTQAFFKKFTLDPANQRCIDCGIANPQWASRETPEPAPRFACVFCLSCSGKHRGLGVHIDFVRSVYMDSWKDVEITHMEMGGNQRLQQYMKSKGVENLPIEKKYTSHALLLYKEQLSCKVTGRPYREAEALKDILAMEANIKARAEERERQRAMSSNSTGRSTSIGSIGSNGLGGGGGSPAGQGIGGQRLSWDAISDTTSNVIGRAVSSTQGIASSVHEQIQSTTPQCMNAYASVVDSASNAIRGLQLGESASSWTSSLSSYLSNATTAITETINSARNPEAATAGSVGGQAAEDGNPGDLSDLFGGGGSRRSSATATGSSGFGGGNGGDDGATGGSSKAEPRDESDLSDLFGPGAVPSKTSSVASKAAPGSHSDLSDLFGPVDDAVNSFPSSTSNVTPSVTEAAEPATSFWGTEEEKLTTTPDGENDDAAAADTSWADEWDPAPAGVANSGSEALGAQKAAATEHAAQASDEPETDTSWADW